MAEHPKRFSASRSLFYGSKRDENEEISDISYNSDDSVDDPNFVASSDDEDNNTTQSSVNVSCMSDVDQPSGVGESSGNVGEAIGGDVREAGGGDDVSDAGGEGGGGVPRGRRRERGRGATRPKRGRVVERGLSMKEKAKKKRCWRRIYQ